MCKCKFCITASAAEAQKRVRSRTSRGAGSRGRRRAAGQLIGCLTVERGEVLAHEFHKFLKLEAAARTP
jgi:hypothetical protein